MLGRMSDLLTTRQVAERAKRSRSQVNRDATSGRLAVAVEVPGYRGARLFDPSAVQTYIAALSAENADDER